MSLVTTCPRCGTVFRMVREQLEASGGWVRCGHCMEVFDAKTQFTPADLLADANAALAQAEGTAGTASDHLSFVASAKRQAFWASTPIRLALMLLAVVLLLLLFVQLLRAQPPASLVSFAPLALWQKKSCALWPCTQRNERQIDAWVIENVGFQKETASRESASTAFRLTALLKNNSQRTLLTPHVELTLLDSQEAVLVRRTFAIASSELSLAEAAAERSVNALIAPSEGSNINARDITGYRLVLFYP